jgi:hypothetical protein
LAAIASLLGSRELKTFAQEVEQRDAGVFEFDIPPHAVDGKADGEIHKRAPEDATVKLGAQPPTSVRGLFQI